MNVHERVHEIPTLHRIESCFSVRRPEPVQIDLKEINSNLKTVVIVNVWESVLIVDVGHHSPEKPKSDTDFCHLSCFPSSTFYLIIIIMSGYEALEKLSFCYFLQRIKYSEGNKCWKIGNSRNLTKAILILISQ
jgi:hypothetical protein